MVSTAYPSYAYVGLFKSSTGEFAIAGYQTLLQTNNVKVSGVRWEISGVGWGLDKTWGGTYVRPSHDYYAVYFDPTVNQMNIYRTAPGGAGVNLKSANVSWSPNQARQYSVVSTIANQMPGGTTDTQTFADAHIRVGGLEVPFDGAASNPNYGIWGLSIPAGGLTMSTWDKACTL